MTQKRVSSAASSNAYVQGSTIVGDGACTEFNHGAPTEERLEAFRRAVWEAGLAYARDNLPWRGTDDAYAVYVSEVMLQQTQVSRVEKFWPRFMEAFPTIDDLAHAETAQVLELWQGLGYNRRALALMRAACACVERFDSTIPDTLDDLLSLPGIGPATAGGILAFAFQKPAVYVETNVRAVFIHEFFAHHTEAVHDRELIPLVEQTCSHDNPRGWYYALLDWGTHIKQTEKNPTRRSAHYARQSTFEGSHRQKRAFILRTVLAHSGISFAEVGALLNTEESRMGRPSVDQTTLNRLVDELAAEGFFQRVDDALQV